MAKLEFKHISKIFPGVRALDDVSFVAESGQVVALLGENGAGKSTLLKVLNGDYKADGGQYLINDKEQHFKSPLEAIDAGISIIYQERQIVPYLSVAENIFMEKIPTGRFGFIDRREMNRQAQEIIDTFELPIKATDRVRDLSVAHQQMVEIMKAYMRMTMNEVSSCVPRSEGSRDAFLAAVPDFNPDKIIDANYDGTTEQGYDVAAATITAHPEITKWLVTAPNDEGASGAARALEAANLDKDACVVGAGAYDAKKEFKKDFSCFRAAAYFSSKVTGETEAQAAIEFLRDGKEIFGEYHETKAAEGDTEFGIFPLGGVMVDPTNYVEVMGPDAE